MNGIVYVMNWYTNLYGDFDTMLMRNKQTCSMILLRNDMIRFLCSLWCEGICSE